MSGHAVRRARTGVLVLGTAVLMGMSSLVAAPARADALVVACHWIVGDYASTYTCTKPSPAIRTLSIADCWRYPATSGTHVRKSDARGTWKRTTMTVRTKRTKACPTDYRYRIVLRVPGSELVEGEPTLLRLTMPRGTVTLPKGKKVKVARTVEAYGACLMPADSTEKCPETQA